MSALDTWERRVYETLDYLANKTQHTFRSSNEGQTIEAVACRLASRSSWWVYESGRVPEIDKALTVPDWVLSRRWCLHEGCLEDMGFYSCPNDPTVCVEHCGCGYKPVSD